MPVAMRYGSGEYTRSGGASGSGSSGGITMTLLWTNPSPTSSFAAQTVSLDLSSYDAVLITYRSDTSSSRYGSLFVPKDGNNYYVSIGINSTSNNYFYKRGASVDGTGVTFTTGYRDTTAGTSYALPINIYGIKGIT